MIIKNRKIGVQIIFYSLSLLACGNSWSATENTPSFNYLNVVNPIDTQNNLYQQILDEMNLEYENIGKREAERILNHNSTTVTGGLNSIGLSYQRPFVNFSISADRGLAPDLFDDKRWIVTDTFSIYIDASKVMGNLKDQKVIDMSQTNLTAFGGIVFKRTYTWVHFANSYAEGLSTHFEKLFLPFNALNFENINKMQTNEMIFKEDSISAKAGGLVSIPLYTGVNGMAGVLAKFEKLSHVEVISSPTTTGMGDDIHLSFEKTKIASAGISVGIQADFLKILKLTLLSYDFSYDLASSYKIYLNFNRNNLQSIPSDSPVVHEVSELLKNREGDLKILAPYIISEEKKIAQDIKNQYNFLLLGGSKKSNTEQIEVTTDGRVKTFFRHYYEKIKYTEDLMSVIFSGIINAITNTQVNVDKMAVDTKKVTIEYDSERNLLENREDLNVLGNEQKLSMTFSADFMTKKSKGSSGKKYRDRAVFMLERYSGIDPTAVGMVQNESLVAPFNMTGKYQVNTDGIRYLNSLSAGQVFDYLDGLCNEYPKTIFSNARNLFDNCRRSLQNDYLTYFKDLSHEKITIDAIDSCESGAGKIFSAGKSRAFLKDCLYGLTFKDKDNWTEIPLWDLKSFANNIVNNSYSKVHYYNLFGVQNVFFYGSFDAITSDGQNFTSSFHEGAFKGLGTVDNYMRLENLRAPASVVVDQ